MAPETLSSLSTTRTPYWQHRGFIAYVLWPLSLVFSILSKIRRWWLQKIQSPWKAKVPVVIVGNITAGGAGKTPTVIALVKHFQAAGYHVGVISRGYGRNTNIPHTKAYTEVLFNSQPTQTGDEPLLIKRSSGVPVFVAAKRILAAQALLAQYPETTLLISDDGLQHYALGRDVEIAVFDDQGVGNGWLIPAGPLREPVSRARSVDLVLYNANTHPSDLISVPGFMVQRRLGGYLPLKQWAKVASKEWLPLNILAQQQRTQKTTITAAAGIGNPQRFFSMLMEQDIALARTLALPDHHNFTQSPFDTIHSGIILITEKDATKCLQLKQLDRLYVVTLCYEPEPAFFQRLDTLLATLPAPSKARFS